MIFVDLSHQAILKLTTRPIVRKRSDFADQGIRYVRVDRTAMDYAVCIGMVSYLSVGHAFPRRCDARDRAA
jgi:hypothetical protein